MALVVCCKNTAALAIVRAKGRSRHLAIKGEAVRHLAIKGEAVRHDLRQGPLVAAFLAGEAQFADVLTKGYTKGVEDRLLKVLANTKGNGKTKESLVDVESTASMSLVQGTGKVQHSNYIEFSRSWR
eukprot:6487809-Amphidinium_carterae.2